MVLGSFFASQLDFVFFIYGLTFELMGGQSLAPRRRDRTLLWDMLAAFGIIHGLNEWLDTPVLSRPDTFVFKGAGIGCFTAEAS